MRKTCFAAIVTVVPALGACAGEQPPAQPPPAPPPAAATASAAPELAPSPTPPPAPKPSLAELIPRTLNGIGEAFNAHDSKKLASYFTEDCTAVNYGVPEAHGRGDIASSTQIVFDSFGDAKNAALRVWIKGNVAISELAWAGTMTGDLMMLKASHKPVGELRLHIMWFNDDGLVKAEHEYGDQAGLMAQIMGGKGAPPVPVLPTNGPDVHVAKDTPEEDKLADWAKSIDASFDKGDASAAAAQVADDAEWWMDIAAKPATKGKKALAQELGRWFKAFPDQKWATENAWGIDGFAIIEHTVSGTQKGPLGALTASNKPVKDWHWVDIVQPSADGKIERGWGYANLLELMEQTGALKLGGERPSQAAPGGAAQPPRANQ
jgi:ketosteroid isomerase-like protein